MLQSCTHWQNRNFQSNPIAYNGTDVFLFLGLTEDKGGTIRYQPYKHEQTGMFPRFYDRGVASIPRRDTWPPNRGCNRDSDDQFATG